MKRVFATTILIAATLLGSSSALADGWITGKIYVGGSLGQSDVDTSVTEGLITSGTVDGKDSAYKIFGGLQFHPNFAAELAYVNLGTVNYQGSYFGLPVTGGKIDISGFSAAGVGRINFDNFSIH